MNIDCAPVNDFGYIVAAKGTLAIGARKPDGALAVQGLLQLTYRLFGDPETAKQVQVDGTVDKEGQIVTAKVVSGAPDLDSVLLVIRAGADSHVDGPGGSPQYQTRCASSTVTLPQGSDLQTDGTLRFYSRGDGTIGVQVNVVNIGNQPAMGSVGRVTIGPLTASAALYQYFGGTATAANTVNPGERGYLMVVLPDGALSRCTRPRVVLDVDHTFQSGDPDPFLNDSADVATPCLTWSRPISEDALGFTPDAILQGKTLGDVVGSFTVGRSSDGQLCSTCHFQQSGKAYAPPITAGSSGKILPSDMIGGTTWAAPDGWAHQFVTVMDPKTKDYVKPFYLRAVVQQWIDDGARP